LGEHGHPQIAGTRSELPGAYRGRSSTHALVDAFCGGLSGDPQGDRDFSCFYLKSGELIAADCVNRLRDSTVSKRIIAQRSAFDRAQLLGHCRLK
jgi:hypothetical protein